MQQFLDNAKQFFERLSTGQKAALGGVLIGGVALLVSIAYWANRPDYALLFGNLDTSDANSVVQALNEQQTPYDIRNGGSSIYVPREEVYELRMRFASEGLVSEGQTGYELFDRGTLGMTDFMQKLNKKRALEGELSRTISNIEQVEMARVHLVMPERSPFRDQQTEASASVVLKPRGTLNAGQTKGISELVAGAVEDMNRAAVTILDTEGNMLSDPKAGNPTAELTSTQLEMQRSVEEHMRKSGQSMLNEVLGSGNAILRVSAKLNFDEKTTQRNLIDPESGSIISEEQLREENQDENADSRVRNYEYSRSTERVQEGIGEVSYVTVSVIVNHKRDATGAGNPQEETPAQQASFAPRSQVELEKIESLVKNAVGFNPERGDRFTIQQTRFNSNEQNRMVTQMREQEQNQRLEMYIRYGLMALALLLVVWLIRSTSKHVGNLAESPIKIDKPLSSRNVTDGSGDPEASPSPLEDEDEEITDEEAKLIDDMYTNKLSAEAKANLKAKHKMYEGIKSSADDAPNEAADLINSWLAEDEFSGTR